MKVMVIGNGGRENAICHKLSISPLLEKLYCCPGNGGTKRYAENVDLPTNEAIVAFAVSNEISLVIVGPEKPLCEGLVDLLAAQNILCFGANQKSAMLEASKNFAKQFMIKHQLPTAKYHTAYQLQEAMQYLAHYSYPVVLKADGLCAGKGVKIAQNEEEAYAYLKLVFEDKVFGNQGSKVVIEQFLQGIEASLLCVVSGHRLFPLESAKDYKRIFDNDKGENTGGVGCYSPSELFTPSLHKEIDKILRKIENGLQADQLEYNGILFIGLMIENGIPHLLEFNVRFGDPETEVVLPRLESDLITIIQKAIDNTLTASDLKWKKEKSLTVVLTASGYPEAYEKGKVITGLENVSSEIIIYHNNTKQTQEGLVSDGGRVLSITILGDAFETMRQKVYENIRKIHFEGMQYRKDIAQIK